MTLLHVSSAVLAAGLLSPTPGLAQEAAPPVNVERVKSMGFPPRWKPYMGITVDRDARGERTQVAGQFALGVYRDIMGPVTGLLGVSVEAYVRPTEDKLDGGGRLYATSPILHLRFGADYSARDERVDFILSTDFPLRRGGVFGHGSGLRIDWVPARNHYLAFGFDIKLGQPYLGKTRPRRASVTLPGPADREWLDYAPPADLGAAMAKVEHAADWVNRFTTPLFDLDINLEADEIDDFTRKVRTFRDHIALQDGLYPRGHTAAAEVAIYHAELDRALALALDVPADSPTVRATADKVRELLLDDVLLPYDRLLAQLKRNDTLAGWGSLAAQDLDAWLRVQPGIDAAGATAASWVFRRLIEIIDEQRDGARRAWKDSRFVWLPLRYALRPEDHDTQAEIDEVLEKATQHRFTVGNDGLYLINEQFQLEVPRTIREAEDYHVLWLHDYRGYDDGGVPDEVSYNVTRIYLETFIERVRGLDDGGPLPVFMLFLDQHYFEITKGALWLRGLADPLHRAFDLPGGFEDWESTLEGLRRELGEAVAASRTLQEMERTQGRGWIRNRVKLHVSITNPADFSFTARHVIPRVPFIPDVLMRDHRKLVFFDVTEEDPARGEAIYTGTGVGEHYAGPNWEDRSYMVSGPSLVDLKNDARQLLLSQGFDEAEIPYPLRRRPFADDYAEMVESLVDPRYRARAMQLHNETGFATKPANLVKAVLYELMPAGSLIVSPNSLWNSPLWSGMLSGAAIRGCRVLVIGPSKDTAPSNADFTMSRANEIFTQLVLTRAELGDAIADAGGMLEVGIWNLDVDVSDVGAVIHFAAERAATARMVTRIFGFDPAVGEAFLAMPDRLAALGIERVPLVEDAADRGPKLHTKATIFYSAAAVERMARLPSWPEVTVGYLTERGRQAQRDRYVPARQMAENLEAEAGALLGDWLAGMTDEERDAIIMYFEIGSHNQDYRSAMMDGEVIHLESGLTAIAPVLDFILVIAASEWIQDVERLYELLPPHSGLAKAVGRWIKNAL